MLELAILGLLKERDLHGYEIRKQLREHLGLLANVSFGSLYPALARLEAARDVVGTEMGKSAPPPAGPPTGSLSGERSALLAHRAAVVRPKRAKKVYSITEQGRATFAMLLAGSAPGEDSRAFGLRLCFARHLTSDARITLLERRRAQLVNRLSDVELATKGHDLDPYARAVVDHTADGVARDIAWLDSLLAAEMSQPPSQHQPTPDRLGEQLTESIDR